MDDDRRHNDCGGSVLAALGIHDPDEKLAKAELARHISQITEARTLTDRDMAALLAACANPPEPNEAMLRSILRWRKHGGPV